MTNFHSIRFDNDFLDMTSKVWTIKEKIDKLGSMTVKHFCISEHYQHHERQSME